jgi:DNA sulfur modification protein DndD
LRGVSAAGVAESIVQIETELGRLRVSRNDLEIRQQQLADRVKKQDADRSAVARTRKEFEEVSDDVRRLSAAIEEQQKQIAELYGQGTRLRQQISKVSGPDLERLNREVATYEALIAVFSAALDEFRDQVREAVERDATDIFLQLTSDKTYTGLRINHQYGLTILDRNGRDVQVRSAGAEQVVALSLIGALSRNAVRDGPIIMDTPFGRLDATHRENILRFLPTLSEQVTLLVHSREVDRDRDLEHIKDKISREYTIEYISSSRSQLEVLRDN